MNRILCNSSWNSLYWKNKEELEFKIEKEVFSVLMLQMILMLLNVIKKALKMRALEFLEELLEFSVLNLEFSVFEKEKLSLISLY